MLYQQLRLLIPTFFVYWIFLLLISSLTLFGLSRLYPHVKYSWKTSILLASSVALFIWVTLSTALYQKHILKDFEEKQVVASTGGADLPPGSLKDRFLKTLETELLKPQPLSKEVKAKILADHASLFPAGSNVKDDFKREIITVYQCQKIFWEDALASFNAKKVILSEARRLCESKPGQFFNREKIFTDEQLKRNQSILENIASHKRVPSSDGKEIESSELVIRQTINLHELFLANAFFFFAD